MKNDQLLSLCKGIWQTACQYLNLVPEEMGPILHLLDAHDKMEIMMVIGDGPPYYLVEAILQQRKSTFFAFVAESLSAQVPKEHAVSQQTVDKWRKSMPVNMRNWPPGMTKEHLMLTAVGHDFTFQQLAEFHRKDGKVTVEKPDKHASSSNRFLELRKYLVRPK